tara:strand:- start:10195 stop:11241 length:1047 start_codon:yes stop_codon:yes gene_type:complete
MKDFKETFIKVEADVRTSIEIIHKSGHRIGLVVDKESKLLGTVTDGDIRRALLNKIDMSESVLKIMNEKPTFSSKRETSEEKIKIMQDRDILHIPILDSDGSVIGLDSIHDLLKKPTFNNPVVIMAGGFGKRLMPLTEDTPKPLLKIGTKPILERIINNFAELGFRNFYISLHYKADMIKDYFGNGSDHNVSINYLEEKEPMGTAGCLSLLPENLLDLPIILMNGDLITDLNFVSLLENHNHSGSEATICVAEYDFQVPYGVLEVDENEVKSIAEKPVHKFFVNAGIYVLNKSILSNIEKNKFTDMPDVLSKKISNKESINTFPIFEKWIDIGRISDFNKANEQVQGS